MTKRNKLLLLSGSCVFIVLAILFFFFDLNISKTVVQDNPSFIFLLFAAIGEFPIYLGPILFGLVFGFTSENKNMRLGSHLVGLIGTYFALTRLVNGVFEVFFSSEIGLLQYSLLALASLFLYMFMFIVFNKIDRDNLEKLKDIALIYLIVTISSVALVSVIKFIWGRPRYRILSPDYSEYTNYLVIHGLSNGSIGTDYRSFPSGHTNAATSILILSLIAPRFSSKKWIKYLISGACYLYVLIMAISRVCVGAHYASDVLFGFGISSICFLTTYIIFKKKGWLYVRSNKC